MDTEDDREAAASPAENDEEIAAERRAALAAVSSEEPLDWPRCGYCGSTALRESRRGGLATRLLRFAGCTVYRCENCDRRFAFSPLGHPERHHSGERVSLRSRLTDRPEDHLGDVGRRRAIGVLTTLLAALFTFFAAGWLISRAERRRLEGDGGSPPP